MHTNTHLILLGAGKVGREVIRLIQACGLPIRFTAITDSQLFVIGNPLQPAVIQAVFDAKASGQWLIEFSGALPLHKPSAYYQADAIVVGTSASRSLDLLPALQAGCKLVFVNKNAMSSPWRIAPNRLLGIVRVLLKWSVTSCLFLLKCYNSTLKETVKEIEVSLCQSIPIGVKIAGCNLIRSSLFLIQF